ncbi:swi snf family dna-dependent atpase [Diplodia corticola]|uniref:Swi snf family dna-dependent atpase n=1 Tax=Diplodia corticola TaxID=236234 RepID=A0A1J9RT80_9PEZI|nr:swi snf family dna-dependent atpase [Diplodia corticola]OJD35755.1 swi snf family dna-dependent atpase [Diplodia corticola]
MILSSLGPGASAQEIQDDITFMQILIDTLDPHSESFEQDRADREQTITYLQALLGAPQGSTAGPSSANDSYQSVQTAPFQSHGAYQHPGESSNFFTSSARKRPRAFDDALAADHANKSSRTTPSPAATTPGTSSSNDSYPELYEAWPSQAQSQAGGVRYAHSSLNQMLEPPRQSEVQQDLGSQQASYGAGNLYAWDWPAQDQMQSQPPQQSASANFHQTLPTLQSSTPSASSNSPFQVPLRVSHHNGAPSPFQRSVSSQSMNAQVPRQTPQRFPSVNGVALPHSVPSQSIKSEYPRNSPLRTPISRPRPLHRLPSSNSTEAGFGRSQNTSEGIEIIDLCDSDSDPDIQEMAAYPSRNHLTTPMFTPRHNQHASRFTPSRQAYGTGASRMMGGQSIYNSLQGTVDNPLSIDEYEDFFQIVENPAAHGDRQRGGPSTAAIFQGGIMGPNPFTNSIGGDVMGQMPVFYPNHAIPDTMLDRQREWLDRYGGYGQYSQRATGEAVKQLLGNIRPDEDVPPERRLATPEGMAVQLMEHQKLGVAWMKKMEEGSNKGSVLADEMGLGKTVQALSLIVSRPAEDPMRKTTLVIAPVALMRQWEREIKTKVKGGSHALSVMTYHGSKKKSFRDLRAFDIILTSYGTVASEFTKKEKIREFEARDADELEGAPPRPKNTDYPLLGADSLWYRIILDEAHNIRNKETKTSKACCELKAIHRLCMTGTPMMNRTDELYGLVRFLRIQPYCEWGNFRADIKTSLEKGSKSIREDGMRKLQALLKAILLRRTQESKIDGKVIFELPPKTITMEHVVFDEDQDEFYRALESKTQLKFNKYLKAGTVGKSYSHILVLLLRLRQACCHPHLLKDFAEPAAGLTDEELLDFAMQLGEDVVARIKAEEGAFSCPICLDGVENPAIFLPCGHNACSECFARITSDSSRGEEGYKCPNCRGKLDPKRITDYNSFKKVHMPDAPEDEDGPFAKEEAYASSDSESDADEEDDLDGFIVPDDEVEGSGSDPSKQKPKKSKGKERRADRPPKQKKTLAQLRREAHRNIAAKRRYFNRLCKDWVTSAKVDRTMGLLRSIQTNDPTEKTLVFSQFTSLLDIVEVPLAREEIEYCRLDGSMSVDLRNDSVNRFIDSPSCNVMLVSLKAGNAGLNLNAASQVIILDPFWNPYVEYQAIGRAHRLGQTRPVTVSRILVKKMGSEDQHHTVEDRIMALQQKKEHLITQALDEEAGKSLSKLTIQDLAFLFGVRAPAG